MNVLRAAVNSSRSIRLFQPNQGMVSVFPKRFSSEAEGQKQDAAVDSFLRTPPPGLVYGKLQGITKYTTRSDILNLFDGCNLNPENIKIDYNRSFAPMFMLIQFPSRDAYEAALRATRKDRFHRLDLADRSMWEIVKPYDGKSILLQGIPRNALPEDVERFLSGCQYDTTSMRLFARPALPDPIRMAVVSFPSQALASHACITKDRGFCLNNQISVRVLQ